jgi:predicted transcriptional regulator of viral defense system
LRIVTDCVTIIHVGMKARTVGAPDIADWALARGRSSFTSAELAELLNVSEDQVRRRLHAPARRGEWVMPVRGLWVPVPPEFRLWGGPPGIELVDAMMRHLGVGYYVGWLTAAGLHGAAHQAPQVFQVGVNRQVRDRQVGRTRFEFAQRDVVGIPTVTHPTRSGTALVSTPAATALDVAADIARSGGADNAATVILELAEVDRFDVLDVAGLAPRFPAAAGRRVGWMLERFAQRDDLDPLRLVVNGLAATPSRLDPAGAASGELDARWLLYLNRALDPDT